MFPMKKHAIIPIFIPHAGCGHSCVFCNQKVITAREQTPGPGDVIQTVETWLSTLEGRGLDTIELSFFGGSFTGIPEQDQRMYLDIALAYKKKGRIDKIHMSTRPDYINRDIMDMLREYTVDTIELGVQSFDDDVLEMCRRGHTSRDVYDACALIKEYGIELGIQLMIGLPGDTKEKAIESARKAALIRPSLARLYPTVVLPDTQLARMMHDGSYTPLSESDAIDITKEMYRILMDAGINIMRVGLKSTDLVTTGTDLAGNYHPAFRQLVEGEIMKENMTALLSGNKDRISKMKKPEVIFSSNEKWFPPMIGHKACNKNHFADNYPEIIFSYEKDNTLSDGYAAISVIECL